MTNEQFKNRHTYWRHTRWGPATAYSLKKFREMFISFPDEMYKLTYLRLNLD